MTGLSIIESALAESAEAIATHRPMGRTAAKLPRNFVIPTDYQSFTIGKLGNFPYYWEDPATLKFNKITYGWIQSAVVETSNSIALDGVFTNQFITAMSMLSYSLSETEQNQLRIDNEQAKTAQYELLRTWNETFREVLNIDDLVDSVISTWAVPPTTLMKLKLGNPKALLNQIPPQGETIVPKLMHYLNELKDSVPLQNKVSKNRGLLHRALVATQNPTSLNGAIELCDNSLVPGFEVLTPVSEIKKGLLATTSTVHLKLAVTSGDGDSVNVAVNDAAPKSMAGSDLLTFESTGGRSAIGSILARNDSTLLAEFPGVTTVQFCPMQFSFDTLKGWYWVGPILDALANAGKDASSFKFSKHVEGLRENFGFPNSVIISRNPSIKIVTEPAVARQIADTAKNHRGANLKFLSRPLGALSTPNLASAASYAAHEGSNDGHISLQPTTFDSNVESRAFVLAIRTEFPAI